MRLGSVVLALVSLCLLSGYSLVPLVVVQASEGDGISFPTKPVEVDPTPEPKPTPEPEVVSEITIGEVYVITAPFPIVVAHAPAGVLKITKPKLPVTIFAKFAGGAYEYREFKEGTGDVWFVGGVKAGKSTIVVVPTDAVDESRNVQQVLTVSGFGPRPPPDPDPTPEPEPEPEPEPTPVESFRVIFIKESGSTLSPQQTAIPGAKVLRDYLNDKTTKSDDGQVGWREYDPQSTTATEPVVIQELWKAIKQKSWTVPCVAIEVNGKVTVVPFPTDVAEALSILKKAGGD